MHVFSESTLELETWIRSEVEFERELRQGDTGTAVKRVQEWLNLHGFNVSIDSLYGPVTAHAVAHFQEDSGLAASGEIDERTFDYLVRPMRSVVQQRLSASFSIEDAVLDYASAHLAVHPVEVGGENRGPWVRLYMRGNEGPDWRWCAGFVTFVLQQAAESLNTPMPIDGSFSCDTLAAQANTIGLFLSGEEALRSLRPGSIFLVRRALNDWSHTGFVTGVHESHFETTEGNTNFEGGHEGFEVCSRLRGYANVDFILLTQPLM